MSEEAAHKNKVRTDDEEMDTTDMLDLETEESAEQGNNQKRKWIKNINSATNA